MAEAAQDTTFLDKLINAGEIGTPSLALIPGLTRAQEDQMIRDIADRAVGAEEDYLAYDKDDFDAAHKSRMYRLMATDQLEDMIHNMPEEIQDQWVLSAWDTGTPIYKELGGDVLGQYHDGRVYLDRYEPKAYIHENEHAADYMSSPYEKFPSSLIEGTGKVIRDEGIDEILRRNRAKELPTEKIKESPSKWIYGLDFTNSHPMLRQTVDEFVQDMLSMHPDVTDYDDDNRLYGFGHGSDYRDVQAEIGRLKNLDEMAARNCAMSKEGTANVAEILAAPGGLEFMQKHYPMTLETMLKVADNDIRIQALRNGGDIDGFRYSLPEKYVRMTDAKEYDRNHPRQYFRSKSPYGYSYYGDGTKAYDRARKMGNDTFEWQDSFGDWQSENINRFDLPKQPTFNDQFNYYVDTPYGRKGYKDSYDALLHMAAFPGEENVYRKGYQLLDDGTLKTSWEKEYPQFWGRTVRGTEYDKKRIEEMKKQRELLERARQNRKAMGLPSLVKKVR